MSQRTTVRLPKDLLERAKRKAAAEGCTLSSLVEDGLRLVLRLPPVSKATGGLMPDVELTSFSAVQEIDDLEYVERMKHFK
jgi:hypothetical protein